MILIFFDMGIFHHHDQTKAPKYNYTCFAVRGLCNITFWSHNDCEAGASRSAATVKETELELLYRDQHRDPFVSGTVFVDCFASDLQSLCGCINTYLKDIRKSILGV